MRISSLQISGFKSFADRVNLVFGAGISGIVGPNGCGKSNVVDAVRWVMGEQNPRHLRGRLMEDIVFSGTESRPPVGMAEVVLTLDTTDARVPAGYEGFTEVQIARRLYRSGESEYLINRVPCRLRDVVDFFLDTGVGTRGYTIVEQGQIASIVSTRPEDRRFIIEEAAGIGKYRQRRRETERKLEATQQNLVRVHDILGELRRQIASLDRQARKAKRYKELKARLRDLELIVARRELDERTRGLEGAEHELAQAQSANAGLDARLAQAQADLEAGRHAQLEREQAMQSESERLFALRGEIQTLESRIEYERREREGLLRLAEQREGEVGELAEQLEETEASLRAAREELAGVEARLADEERERTTREAQLQVESERLSALHGRREALQARWTDLATEIATLQSREAALEERREELQARLRQSEEELDTSALAAESLRREADGLEGDLRGALAERDDLGRQLASRLQSLAAARDALERLQRELGAARDERQRVGARLEALHEEEQRATREGTDVLARLREHERSGARGRLADALRIEPGLERALEAALGARLDGILVEDAERALALLGRLRAAEAGRMTVLTADGPHTPGSGFVPLGRPLLDAIEVKPPFEPLVQRLLADVVLVESLAEAVGRYGAHAPPAVFVTREGEVLDRLGTLTGGTLAPLGTLSRKGEIRRLEGQARELATRGDELECAETETDAEVQRLAAEVENARSRQHTAELAVLHFEKDLERSRERGKQAVESIEDKRGHHARLVRELDRAREELDSLGERLLARGGERRELEEERDRLGIEAGTRAREVERLKQRFLHTQVELAERVARRDRLRESRGTLERSLTETREWLGRRREEIRHARERGDALAAAAQEASRGLADRISREEEIRAGQERLREAWEEAARDVEARERGVQAVAREREAGRERFAALELQAQEARMRREQLLERVRDRYAIDLAAYLPPADLAGEDLEARRAEVSRLRQSLESLGEVHLGAIEEYEEVAERFRYLSEQKADLEVSIERLRNAIARINRTSRARFRETFEHVNAEFQKTFPRLFRGGRAHLSLTEAEDVLEAGIEITAQPPGKKLQNVNLLSGGEKSLTAIALLFAVFTVKPSPFFLLDEVDAALDDANVVRFNDLVKEMASRSQFLLITHNKGTIEIADTLFGITMEEPGLSQVVTVDLVS